MSSTSSIESSTEALVALETRFWQALVDQDADAALALLAEPALMVGPHGAIQFDHQQYRRMADKGPMIVKAFQFSEMQAHFPDERTAILTYRVRQDVAGRNEAGHTSQDLHDTSTWVRAGTDWKCVMHTETPAHAGA